MPSPRPPSSAPAWARPAPAAMAGWLGIHYRGVQWEGVAVDWGSIIY